MIKFLSTLLLVSLTVQAQDDDFAFEGSAFNFQCPEPNGLFADPEQCDLYYVCEDNVASPELCEDGLLFDDSRRNKERCVLPHGVDCGAREFVQQPQEGIDPRCPRANGTTLPLDASALHTASIAGSICGVPLSRHYRSVKPPHDPANICTWSPRGSNMALR